MEWGEGTYIEGVVWGGEYVFERGDSERICNGESVK